MLNKESKLECSNATLTPVNMVCSKTSSIFIRAIFRGAEAGDILGVNTPHFLEDPKNGS